MGQADAAPFVETFLVADNVRRGPRGEPVGGTAVKGPICVNASKSGKRAVIPLTVIVRILPTVPPRPYEAVVSYRPPGAQAKEIYRRSVPASPQPFGALIDLPLDARAFGAHALRIEIDGVLAGKLTVDTANVKTAVQ